LNYFNHHFINNRETTSLYLYNRRNYFTLNYLLGNAYLPKFEKGNKDNSYITEFAIMNGGNK